MIKDILTELDRLTQRAMAEAVQPISNKVQYEAGKRIGVVQGIQRAREAIVNMHSKDNDKDDKL